MSKINNKIKFFFKVKTATEVLALLCFVLLASNSAYGIERGEVISRFGSCDYFIADGPNGYYVLEWYGGYDPYEGDSIIGDIGSYGFADVLYNEYWEGRVYVEDYWESWSSAIEEIEDHC